MDGFIRNIFLLYKKYWKYQVLFIIAIVLILFFSVISKKENYEPVVIGKQYLTNNQKLREDIGRFINIGKFKYFSDDKKTVKDSTYSKLYFKINGTKKSKIIEIEFTRNNSSESWEITSVRQIE